jgi:tetratricopeptide (TPR) repeat protein
MCFPLLSISQDQKIDSLKSLLPIKTGVEYSRVLFELAWIYLDVDNDVSYAYAEDAFESAKNTTDSLMIVKTGRIKSQAFRRLGKLDSAIALFDKMLPIAIRNNFLYEVKTISNGLGIVYLDLANYDKALKHFFECLKIAERDNDHFGRVFS